jgi:hypothetical protein
MPELADVEDRGRVARPGRERTSVESETDEKISKCLPGYMLDIRDEKSSPSALRQVRPRRPKLRLNMLTGGAYDVTEAVDCSRRWLARL